MNWISEIKPDNSDYYSNCFFALAMTSNPWTIATVIEADMEAAYAGYSIDAQQTACFSSFGGNGNSA